MKAVILATGAIGEVLGIERRDDGNDYVYFQSGLCKPISEVGFLNPYEQYEEDCYDQADFRREAAKDILCAILANGGQTDDNDNSFATSDECITFAVRMADKLIAKLKHNEQLG